nr:carboxypeptidase-like regulatory domain-containing protein [uncultured Marinifilum sp.]
MKTLSLSLLLVISFAFNMFAQDKSDLSFIVSGKVINSETNEGVSFAHINLDDTYWGIICDSLGFFHLRVNPDQKLKISAMGFKEQIVSIVPPSVENKIFQEIYMEKESYMLKEVDVYSLGSWNDFKEQFVKQDTPEEENIASSFDFGNLKLAQAEAKTLKHQGFGMSFNIWGSGKKRTKGLRTIDPLQDLHDRMLSEKYNRDIVAEITHESGTRLDLLMKYINSNTQFSYQTRDIYIVSKIKQLHNKFIESNPTWDYDFTYTDSLGHVPNHLRP